MRPNPRLLSVLGPAARWHRCLLLITVLGSCLFPWLGRAQVLTYSPTSKALIGGGNFLLAITAPPGSGAFGSFFQLTGTGAKPIPALWLGLIFPPAMSFSTSASNGDTQTCLVNINVPAGTPAGTYTGTLRAFPTSMMIGAGAGADLTVTVGSDTTPPVLSLPPDVATEATGPNGAVVTFGATATDTAPANPIVTCSPPSGSVFPLGTTTVICSTSDAAGNSANSAFTVVVRDTTPPDLVCSSSPITAEATSAEGAIVSFTTAATDIVDGSLTPVCVPPSGSTFAIGTTTVACSAADARGNRAQCSFDVTVQDTTAPSVTCAQPLTLEATSTAGATVTFTAGATDTVDGSLTPVCVPPSGSTFALGTIAVACSVADAQGNRAQCSFDVTVQDTTAPIVTCAQPLTLEATSAAGATVSFAAGATDTVDGSLTPVCVPPSGSTFAIGTTTVACSAVDTRGNRAQCSFDVTVQDTTAPSVTCAQPLTLEATSAAGATVSFNAGATDTVDGSFTPVCVPPSGSTFAIGTTTVACSAVDTRGNRAQCSFDVTVEDTTPPSLHWSAVPAPTPVAVNTPVSGTIRVSDNCRVTSTTWDWDDGTITQYALNPAVDTGSDTRTHVYSVPDVYTVRVTATDEAGNTTALSFQYVVVYDSYGDFVTGGGRINSPRGAYLPNPALTGQATFGFNSKYRAGATKPSGATEFQFQIASLRFHAEDYEWLVVNGAKAQYMGTGTINGAGHYVFLVTAIDGQAIGNGSTDSLRIQIWDSAGSTVIYDNQLDHSSDTVPTTPISSGNIVVHSR